MQNQRNRALSQSNVSFKAPVDSDDDDGGNHGVVRKDPKALWRKLRLAVLTVGGSWLSSLAALPPPGAVSMACSQPPTFRIGATIEMGRVIPKVLISRFVLPFAASLNAAKSTAPEWCCPVVVRCLTSYHGVALASSFFWYFVVTQVHVKMAAQIDGTGNDEREAYVNALLCNACFHYGLLFCSMLKDQSAVMASRYADGLSAAVTSALKQEFPSDADIATINGFSPLLTSQVRQWLIGMKERRDDNRSLLDGQSTAEGTSPVSSRNRPHATAPTHREEAFAKYNAWVSSGGPSSPSRGGNLQQSNVTSSRIDLDASVNVLQDLSNTAAGGASGGAGHSPGHSRKRHGPAARALHGRLAPRNTFFLRPVPQPTREERGPQKIDSVLNLRIAANDIPVEKNTRLDVVDAAALAARLRCQAKGSSHQASNTKARRPSSASSSNGGGNTAADVLKTVADRVEDEATRVDGAFSLAQCAPLMGMFVKATSTLASGDAGRRLLHGSRASTPSYRSLGSADLGGGDTDARLLVEDLVGSRDTAFRVPPVYDVLISSKRHHVVVEDVLCPTCPPPPPGASASRVALRVVDSVAPSLRASDAAMLLSDGNSTACVMCGRDSFFGHRATTSALNVSLGNVNRTSGLSMRRCPRCDNCFCVECCKRGGLRHNATSTDDAGGTANSSAHDSTAMMSSSQSHLSMSSVGRRLPVKPDEVFGPGIGAAEFTCPPPPTPDNVLTHSMYQAHDQARRRSTFAMRRASVSTPLSRGRTGIPSVDAQEERRKVWASMKQWVEGVISQDLSATAAAIDVNPGVLAERSSSPKHNNAVPGSTKNASFVPLGSMTGTPSRTFGDVLFDSESDVSSTLRLHLPAEASMRPHEEGDATPPRPDTTIEAFEMLKRPTSAFACASGTRVGPRPSTANSAVRSATPSGHQSRPSSAMSVSAPRSVSSMKLSSNSVEENARVISRHQERLRSAVQHAKSTLTQVRADWKRYDEEHRLAQRRAKDIASRTALGSIQEMQHTIALRRSQRRTETVKAMHLVTVAMEACLAPNMTVDEELVALENCFQVVGQQAAALDGGARLKALEYVCKLRPRHGELLREQQRQRRERILHLRHRVAHEVPDGILLLDGDPERDSDDDDVVVGGGDKKVPAVAKTPASVTVSGGEAAHSRGDDAPSPAAAAMPLTFMDDPKSVLEYIRRPPRHVRAVETDKAIRGSGAPAKKATIEKFVELKPSSSWENSTLIQLKLHHATPHQSAGPLRLVDGKLTWSHTGVAIGASATELAAKLVQRGYVA